MKIPGIAKTLSEFETQIDFVNTIPTDLVGNLYLLERKKMSRKSQKTFATCHGKLNRELLEAKKISLAMHLIEQQSYNLLPQLRKIPSFEQK